MIIILFYSAELTLLLYYSTKIKLFIVLFYFVESALFYFNKIKLVYYIQYLFFSDHILELIISYNLCFILISNNEIHI